MAAETFPRVSPGDPLRISAETWNGLMGLGRDQRAANPAPTASTVGNELPPGVIWLKNNSGHDRTEFDILGISNILIAPADNPYEFKYTPGLVGVAPADPDHVGKWVVLLEPIADGQIGRARLFGVAPVTIDVITEHDCRAEIINGETAKLRSGAIGSARILWKESGTGDKNALIQCGDGPIGTEHGVLNGALAANGSVAVSRLYWDGEDWTATGHSETVYSPPELKTGSIPSGKRVHYHWSHSARRLEVIAREC